MKKYIKSLVVAAALGVSFVSCDLNTFPEDQLDNDQAIKSLSDMGKAGRGTYDLFVDNYYDDLIIAGDLQGDYVNAVLNFGNIFGGLHRWDYTYADYDVLDVWTNTYKTIAQANFVIDNSVNAVLKDGEQEEFDTIVGEQYLIRAISMYELALKFCAAYNGDTADNANSGIVVSTSYDPLAMPGRSTLQETYDQILSDITTAKQKMGNVAGAANSTVLTSDCITALEARVYLQMGDDAKALAVANSLIGKSTYSLAKSVDDFRKIWADDTGSEIIFKFYASTTELPAYQYGGQFVSDVNSNEDNFTPQYIPTQTLLDMYAEGDIRKEVYFLPVSEGNVTIGGSKINSTVYLMNKYPGNVALRTSAATKNYMNSFKLFRIAEMYLIAAEAAAGSGGDAATPLNALRTARGLEALGTVTLADVKAERMREMLFEGQRIADLKRWGDVPMKREPQTGELSDGTAAKLITEGANYDGLVIPASSDYRFVWPIPSVEIYANQVLISQQNPGWDKE